MVGTRAWLSQALGLTRSLWLLAKRGRTMETGNFDGRSLSVEPHQAGLAEDWAQLHWAQS
eukprot:3821772-Amphidinium_carterae.2